MEVDDQVATLSVGDGHRMVERDQVLVRDRWLLAEVGRMMIVVLHEVGLGTLLVKWTAAAGLRGSFRTWVDCDQEQEVTVLAEVLAGTLTDAAAERPASAAATHQLGLGGRSGQVGLRNAG